jgi:hypothetical protein
VPAMIFLSSASISFAYRLASASVENVLVCLADTTRCELGLSTETNQRSIPVRLAMALPSPVFMQYQEIQVALWSACVAQIGSLSLTLNQNSSFYNLNACHCVVLDQPESCTSPRGSG